MLNSSVLLLTSTISPQDWPFVGRKGVDEREEDYFSAISFAVTICFDCNWVRISVNRVSLGLSSAILDN